MDVSGIPNLGIPGMSGFGGGGGAFAPGGSFGSWDANQINSSMGFNPNANPYDPFAQSGGFGSMTDYYSGLGAAYGRNTGGFGGYGGNNDPFTAVADRGSLGAPQQSYYDQHVANYGYAPEASYFTPGGGYDRDYGGLRGGGGGGGGSSVFDTGTSAWNPYGGGANPGGFSPSPNYPGGSGGGGSANRDALGSSQQSYFDQHMAKYGYAPEQSFFNPGGGWDSMYGGARDQLAQQMQGSNAPAYQGNPYYMPQPMQGGSPWQSGGGFGAPGFGIGQGNYTGQPGFGLGIGQVGPGSVGAAYGSMPDGSMGYGFGGLPENSVGNWGSGIQTGG